MDVINCILVTKYGRIGRIGRFFSDLGCCYPKTLLIIRVFIRPCEKNDKAVALVDAINASYSFCI